MEGNSQEKRHQGQVKFYNIAKGFGFVKDLDDGTEYFVHATSIPVTEDNRSRALYDGEYIEFGVVTGDKGPQCSDVAGIRGGSLLCDNNSRLTRTRRNPRNNGDGNGGQDMDGQMI